MIQVIYAQGRASQTSDVGSIAIARSINLVDSVALPLLTKTRKWAELGFELWIGDPAEINGKRLKKYENSCGKEIGRASCRERVGVSDGEGGDDRKESIVVEMHGGQMSG